MPNLYRRWVSGETNASDEDEDEDEDEMDERGKAQDHELRRAQREAQI